MKHLFGIFGIWNWNCKLTDYKEKYMFTLLQPTILSPTVIAYRITIYKLSPTNYYLLVSGLKSLNLLKLKCSDLSLSCCWFFYPDLPCNPHLTLTPLFLGMTFKSLQYAIEENVL